MMPDAFPVFFSGRQPHAGQAMVMPEVVRGHNVLFAAPTASGKTEAAVTPLYQRHLTFKRRDLSTIYVAPTKALVNDLHERLVTYLETRQAGTVARYTGDRHELRTPSGAFCLLATPEALDSLQLRRPGLLTGVRAVVVDEIHLLHGQPRGQQLRHVIARLREAAAPPKSKGDNFQVVGMTATLGDMAGVAEAWLGPSAKVLSHGSPRDIALQFLDINAAGDPDQERAGALARWLAFTAAQKVLVFSNSRNGAHGLAAHLHRQLEGTAWPVHLHFGALAASERERVEDEMRRQRYGVCVATTTLEIGIDVGDIDAIVLSDPPRSVSGFLQRIGRGNRRSGACRVVAFRATEDDERLMRALVDCGCRGELDDIHDYERPSVRFQQILSLCWRATREDRSLSAAALCSEAGTEGHATVIDDMVESGCLANVRGALIPCDRLMDEADAGRIHTVISSRGGSTAIDIKTGRPAIREADETTVGGAIFHGGTMRRLFADPTGRPYLGSAATTSQSLARIKSSGVALPVSRSIIWGLARQRGFDPVRWSLSEAELVTWGGETYNNLLSALLIRRLPGSRFAVAPDSVVGPLHALDVTLDLFRELARSAEEASDLPLSMAAKFTNPSRYLDELSPRLAAQERRNSIPWAQFRRWIDRIEAIEKK
jgi:ATP-dependent Lhr-like helicase